MTRNGTRLIAAGVTAVVVAEIYPTLSGSDLGQGLISTLGAGTALVGAGLLFGGKVRQLMQDMD